MKPGQKVRVKDGVTHYELCGMVTTVLFEHAGLIYTLLDVPLTYDYPISDILEEEREIPNIQQFAFPPEWLELAE